MSEPRRRKSAAARRAEIVETAIRLSAEIGPDRVTTQHLADEVGVTQPAIFRHFATKSEIWLAVADQIVGDLQAIHSAAETSGNPHDALHKIVGQHLVHVSENPAVPAILFSRELQAENPALRGKFSSLMTERGKAVAELITRAQQDGLHRAEIVATDAAHLLMAAMNGVFVRWSLEERAFDLVDEGGRMLGGLIDSFRS